MEEPSANTPGRYYQVLEELSAELGKRPEPASGLEVLLLTVLGFLGVSSGFGWISGDGSPRGRWVARGIRPITAAAWEEVLPHRFGETRPQSAPAGGLPFVGFVRERQGFPLPEEGGEIPILLCWLGDGDRRGCLGLGPKLRGEDYSEEEREILIGLVHLFVQRTAGLPEDPAAEALRTDLEETRQELDLQRKNREKLQAEFDRQIFYLKTLYDISAELAEQRETRQMLEAFLLMILGTFGFEEGLIQLYDHTENRSHTVHRGTATRQPDPLPSEDLRGLIPAGAPPEDSGVVRGLSRSDFRHPDLWPPALLKGPRFAFALPAGIYGLLVLGSRITSREVDRLEQDLLQTLLYRLLNALGRVKASEDILRLNRDLEARNVRLEKTVQELTQSRSRVEVLEKARTRIKAVLQGELQRSRQVSPADVLFILILGSFLGLIYNLANPGGITIFSSTWFGDPLPVIAPALAGKQVETGQAQWIDARPERLYRQNRLRGARNLPLTLFDFVYLMQMAHLPPERPLIVYGRNFSRRYDREVGLKLKSKGHSRIFVLAGDWPDWRRAGLPVEP